MAVKRTPTEQNVAPPPPSRRPRARRETGQLQTQVQERARTTGFWGNRPPRAMSESVTMIATEPAPATRAATARTRAPTARAKRPTTGSDDFLEEVATNVIPDE